MKKWKWLFLSLLVINLAFFIVVMGLALQPSKELESFISKAKWEESVSLSLIVESQDLNVLINQYLQKEFNDHSLNYEIRLTDQVEVYGTIQAFGKELDISMDFKPEVQEKGDILLKLESLSVGKLNLPIRTILKYANNNFSLPQWVHINAKEESVYVVLQEIEMKNDFHLKVKKFNVEKNEIQFTLISTR